MTRRLDPELVHTRLEALRRLYIPESVAEARARLSAERPRRVETMEERATRCLGELRALDELVQALRRSRSDSR
jgi:hypothetical protein